MKAAENALEVLIGPFRLRNNVRASVTEGMLMPFPVSMQKGKAVARLEKGQKMREASDDVVRVSALWCFGAMFTLLKNDVRVLQNSNIIHNTCNFSS